MTAADSRPRPGVVFWIVVLTAVCGRAAFVLLPVNSDTAMFVYAGKLVAEGGRPGVDLLDNKLPGVGLLMSVPYRAFEAHWWAYAALGLALSLGAAFALARAARRCWGEGAGWATLAAAAVWLNFPPAVYGGLQLETVQVFLTAVAGTCVLTWLRTADWRDAATAGLCVGLATWAKPTAGAVAVAAALAMVAARPRRAASGVAWLLLGMAVPAALCLWSIHLIGAANAVPATLRQLREYAGNSTFDLMDAAKPVLVLLAVGFPCLVLAVVFRRDRAERNATRADALFVLLWLAAETAAVVSQRRMYAYHFLVLAPPAALAAVLAMRHFRDVAVASAFGPVAALTAVWLATTAPEFGRPNRADRVVAYLRDHTAASAAIWVDDYPQTLVETGRRPGSAVPLIFLFANSDDAPAFFSDRLLADFARTRPACVVLYSDLARVADLYRHHMAETARSPRRADAVEAALRRIDGYVRAHYRPGPDLGGVRAWTRDDAALARVDAGETP